jgi:hypothetical protein
MNRSGQRATAADDRIVGGVRVLICDPGVPVLLALSGEPDYVFRAVSLAHGIQGSKWSRDCLTAW